MLRVSRDDPGQLDQRHASASRAVLPMPASPSRTRTRLSPEGGSTSPRSSDTSLSRPINPVSLTANPETPKRHPTPRIRPGFREAKGSPLATDAVSAT